MTDPLFTAKEAAGKLRELTVRWAGVEANERASFQTWFLQFCEALGVPAPATPTDDYRFELPVRVVDRDGELATNYIDAWHAGHFAMEAKMSEPGRANDTLLRKAFGQVRNYASHVSGTPPPYLMVVDVPRTLILWDRWSGSYGDFGAGRHIALSSLHERVDDVALLQDVFARPAARDPRGWAKEVTKDIAGRLAALAAALEGRGLDQERVARFLMRAVFSCFAEDVGLLPDQLFRKTLEAARGSGDPARLKAALELLWRTMDEGGMYGAELLHRFNGHFFKTREALPLEASDVALLIEAASYDWSRVEPSIFGTLLVRALDPEERHRLGAEYTPREYIERLVEPTVVEPIRERWTAVQAVVLQIIDESGKKAPQIKRDRTAAIKELVEFHTWMRGLRFLDPACGSGNFLYVTMAAVKRIEHEVLNEIQRLSGGQGGLVLDEVHPRQFFGIEIKPWAREIAELTLWIGYHQFWRETHGGRTPPNPILEDTGTIECRDAVLAYDAVVHRPEKDVPDPTPRVKHAVTGKLVPDPDAKLRYYEYVNARPAEWPDADFIVGNPPYVGNKRMRTALGDGYVEALRAVRGDISEGVDLVMYWWAEAARRVADGRVQRAGLITTNSIVQKSNRAVVSAAAERGARVTWAIADHPWDGDGDSAAVRVAMTVTALRPERATALTVDEAAHVLRTREVERLNADLTAHADVSSAVEQALLSNSGICHQGFSPQASGFLLDRAEALELLKEPRNRDVVRPFVNGRDLTQRPRDAFSIDFALRTEVEAREYAVPFDIVRSRVQPDRATNKRASYRDLWWRYGEARTGLRDATSTLKRFIATAYVAAHRTFSFVNSSVAPDDSIVVIAVDMPWIGGILSSKVHATWALAAGGRLEDRPRYNKSLCFDPFPFPDPPAGLRERIAALAEKLDTHRKDAIARDERVTMTGMYNVVKKLCSDEALTPKERSIHEIAACGVLRDLHAELDALVAKAYGWSWPLEQEEVLERIVALHDERVEEESEGKVRWLRPDYQIPRFAPNQAARANTLGLDEKPRAKAKGKDKATAASEGKGGAVKALWPERAHEQLQAIGALLGHQVLSTAQIADLFTGAKKEHVARHLETLALMGEVVEEKAGRFRGVKFVG
ncbi:MAG: DNA methyltransferase [Gemmatimonadaceae bacterium]